MLDLLREGRLELVGRLWASTNAAMLGTISAPTDRATALATPLDIVYKPTVGEQPLHDFPVGTLTRREVAAYLVSEATGWSIVPPTVLRDGPFGEGMVQEWVHPDPEADVVEMIVGDDERLRPMALFDAIVNNTDRKGGHILVLPGGGGVRGVDHGVCFSTRPKLRTVLWGWRGEPLSGAERDVVGRVAQELRGRLGIALRDLLATDELEATIARTEELLVSGLFPDPPSDWPAVPWPPF